MGNGSTEAASFRFFGIDVNPLVIAGGIGKQIDAGLVDGESVALTQALAHRGFQIQR